MIDIYANESVVLGLEDKDRNAWLRIERFKNFVIVDKFGEMLLDAEHSRLLASKLNQWAAEIKEQEASNGE